MLNTFAAISRTRHIQYAPRCGFVLRRTLSSTAPKLQPRPRDWKIPVGHPAPAPLAVDQSSQASDHLFDESSSVSGVESPSLVEDIPVVQRVPPSGPTPNEYASYKNTIKKAFPQGWAPPRKLSREAMDGLRALHKHNPGVFTTSVLAERFRISPEAVRRVLKSRWEPSREERARLAQRDKTLRDEFIRKAREKEREERMTARVQKEDGFSFTG